MTIKLFTLSIKVIIIHSLNVLNVKVIGGKIMFEDIKKVLIDAINVDEEEIKPEAKLNDDLGIDSLAAVELALELENEFDIRIEDEELAKLETVQDVIDIIEAKKK